MGTLVPTWGVKVAATDQWIAKAHALGPTMEQQAEAHANAGLFAGSKMMAVLLEEATKVWAQQFDGPAHQDCSVSGADLMDWFTEWRQRARQTLDATGVP